MKTKKGSNAALYVSLVSAMVVTVLSGPPIPAAKAQIGAGSRSSSTSSHSSQSSEHQSGHNTEHRQGHNSEHEAEQRRRQNTGAAENSGAGRGRGQGGEATSHHGGLFDPHAKPGNKLNTHSMATRSKARSRQAKVPDADGIQIVHHHSSSEGKSTSPRKVKILSLKVRGQSIQGKGGATEAITEKVGTSSTAKQTQVGKAKRRSSQVTQESGAGGSGEQLPGTSKLSEQQLEPPQKKRRKRDILGEWIKEKVGKGGKSTSKSAAAKIKAMQIEQVPYYVPKQYPRPQPKSSSEVRLEKSIKQLQGRLIPSTGKPLVSTRSLFVVERGMPQIQLKSLQNYCLECEANSQVQQKKGGTTKCDYDHLTMEEKKLVTSKSSFWHQKGYGLQDFVPCIQSDGGTIYAPKQLTVKAGRFNVMTTQVKPWLTATETELEALTSLQASQSQALSKLRYKK